MVYAQKTYEIKKRALIGTEKILNYIAKKARMNLAEKSDVLQAKADVESKKLSLNQAENFLKISAINPITTSLLALLFFFSNSITYFKMSKKSNISSSIPHFREHFVNKHVSFFCCLSDK
jgi:hypothetical protein